MKNKIALLLIIAMMGMTHPAAAYTSCKGGLVLSKNGETYCKSAGTMNWYSAVNWCKANGGTLLSYATVLHTTVFDWGTFWCSCGSCMIEYSHSCTASTSKTTKYRAICE